MAKARFENRVVYITGAASGMGRATAQLFADEGAKVFAVDVVEAGVKEAIDSDPRRWRHGRWRLL